MRLSYLPARACSGIRVAAAIHRSPWGIIARAKGVTVLPLAVTTARDSVVANRIPPLNCLRSFALNSAIVLPARTASAASNPLCIAIDIPSPVNDGITAA